MSINHTMEQMAIAILRGDEVAAHALADMLVDDVAHSQRSIPPIKDLRMQTGTLRVVLFTNPELGGDVHINTRDLLTAYNGWLRGDGPLVLAGMQADLYLLPESMGLPQPSMVVNNDMTERFPTMNVLESLEFPGVNPPPMTVGDFTTHVLGMEEHEAAAIAHHAAVDEVALSGLPTRFSPWELAVPNTHTVRFMSLPLGEVRIMRLEEPPTEEFLRTVNGTQVMDQSNPPRVASVCCNARWESPYVVVDLREVEEVP